MLRILSAGSLVIVCAVPVYGDVWYVNESAAGSATGESWSNAFTDLQDALAAATAGDQIWVAEGVYTPSTSDTTTSFQLKSGVALYGGFTGVETALQQRDWEAHETILSGDVDRDDVVNGLNWQQTGANSGHVLIGSGADATAVLDGFTIAYGATGPVGTPAGDPLMFGGGMYTIDGDPTIRHCTFRNNRAAFAAGGAMYNWDSSPLIEQSRFLSNSIHLGDGAGMYNGGASAPVIRDCEFIGNAVVFSQPDGAGGGIAHEGDPIVIERCLFEDNTVRPFFGVGGDVGYGGGIHSFLTEITVKDSIFRGNEATFGGGMISWGPATIVNCLFVNNRAVPHPNDPFPEQGGIGAGLMSYSFQPDVVRAVNCTIVLNRGKKQVAVFGAANSVVSIENSIVWGNTGTSSEVVGYWPEQLGGNWEARYSDVQRVFDPPAPGEDPIDPQDIPGCIAIDPQFVDATPAGDLRLAAGSPCIDAGDNGALPPDVTTDLDGLARRADDPMTIDTGLGAPPVVDLGAYEFGAAALCPADLTGDHVVNGADLASLLAGWSLTGAADLNGDGVVNGADLASLLASWGPCD